MRYDIGVLGGFSIRYGGERVEGAAVNRLQALITYLSLRRGGPVSRSEIAFKLWPDSSEPQAHTNLRKALHQVRHHFPEGGRLQSDAQSVRLDLTGDDCLDLADFEAGLSAAEQARRLGNEDAEYAALEAGLGRYAGDLLPNCCDEWLLPERENLRGLFIRATDRLIEILEARRHYRDAIQHARRLLQTDSLREQNYCTLIRLHALDGDRAAALSMYHTCAGVLARELGVEPQASTRELYERLLHSKTAPLQPQAGQAPAPQKLVGREHEWVSLTAAWKAAVAGRFQMVILRGEAGIGKTRLAEDFLRWAQRQGIRAAFAACHSAEGQAPYAPIVAWLRAVSLEDVARRWIPELSRVLPELRQGDAPPQPISEAWQKQAFHEALARAVLGRGEPCLLMLDDIHWCDTDMLEWLQYLLQLDGKTRGLLLATLRTEELPSNSRLQAALVNLRGRDQLVEIDLSRLDRQDTLLLGSQLIGAQLSDAAGAFLFTASEGVPLFIVELARADRIEEAPRQRGVSNLEPPLPPRLRAVVEGRLGRLTAPARAVIEAAAVLGREFSLDLLGRTSELDENTTIRALDELWRRQLVRERGGNAYDFSHDQLREVTLAGISPVRSRWLHERAAQALEAVDAPETLADIANHYERAGMSAQGAAYYAAAARRERGLFALNDAVEHFTRALLFETDRAALAVLHEERGDVLGLLELREDSFQAFEQAFGLADAPLQRARIAHKQIDVISRFRPEVARERYERALRELRSARGEPGYWSEWIQTKFAWTTACYWRQDSSAIEVLLKETRGPVDRHGTLLQKIHFRHMVISGLFIRRRYRLTRKDAAYAEHSVELARRAGNPYLLVTILEAAALSACFSESMVAGERLLKELIDLSEKLAHDNTLRIGRNYLSLLYRRLHRAEACLAETQVLEEALRRGSPNDNYQAMVHANHAWLAYTRGDKAEARRRACAAMDLWEATENPYPFHWCALFVLLALAVDEGKADQALECVRAMLSHTQQRLVVPVETALRACVQSEHAARKLTLARLTRALSAARSCGYL